MKRILCTLLSFLILLSACPISAYAQVIEEELSDGIVYTVNSKTGEVIIKGNGEIPDYSTSPFLFLYTPTFSPFNSTLNIVLAN